MPKLTIDGMEMEVPAGTTVLQAALSRGREIPHYCYHPGLSISGNCRMCLVEIEKAPKLQIGCATPVADGMVVRTDSPAVKKARAAMMEFFLINHPLDCPICDQAGECRLQEYAVAHGTGVSRYTERKLVLDKAVDLGTHVVLDQERCIQCSRCIRFCDEVTGTGELAFYRRGERTVIGIVPERPLANPYSGNVVDLCPVGALTLKEFRFKTRVWYLKNTPSVCVACARGCNVFVGTGTQQELMTTGGQLDDAIKRLVPRFNAEVNDHWMCDVGRLSYQRQEAASRLAVAQAPAGTDAPYEEAVAKAAAALRSGRLAASLSPRLTCEDLYAWRLLFETLPGAVEVHVRRIARGEDDRLLIRADKGGNSTGAGWIFGAPALATSLLEPLRAGRVDTLLVVGDPLDPADVPGIPDGVPAPPTVIYAGPHVAGPSDRAHVLLPTLAWGEESGTVVNFQGRIQAVRRARVPRGEGRPGWRLVADIAQAAGLEFPDWTSAEEVLQALGRAVPEFAGVDGPTVGLLGVPGRAGSETPA